MGSQRSELLPYLRNKGIAPESCRTLTSVCGGTNGDCCPNQGLQCGTDAGVDFCCRVAGQPISFSQLECCSGTATNDMCD